MSITPHQSRSDTDGTTGIGKQMLANTKQTLRDIAYRYENTVSRCHASIVYDEAFWADLQRALEQYTRKKIALLKKSHETYPEALEELRVIERRVIRTAVESFRYTAQKDPFAIHNGEQWDTFMNELIQTEHD